MSRQIAPTFQQYQVFLASPGDVQKERRHVEEVLAELNRTVARSKKVFLQTRRWELDTFPGHGRDVQSILNSQIADMAKCKLFIGIMWNRLGTKTRRASSGTVEEYDLAAKSYKRNGHPEIWFYFRETRLVSATGGQISQLALVDDFRGRVQNQCYYSSYKTPNEFRDLLRKQLIMWLENLREPARPRGEKVYRVNPYKLYYFRQTRKKSYTAVARETGIDRNALRRLENLGSDKVELAVDRFPEVDASTLAALEHALDCQGKLAGGQSDDFLTQYMLFFDTYKRLGKAASPSVIQLGKGVVKFKTQAVVFDFGGTLTQSRGKYTTWEKLWRKLGYSVNECSELHRRYQAGELTHQQWCDQTCAAFSDRKLLERHVAEVAQQIRLVPGVASTVVDLRKRGIKLFIASGSLKYIIRIVLGSLCNEFEEIRANDISFDRDGVVSRILGTPYDFRGKAEFLRRVVRELGISPLDVLFVGNSCNDVFASESGVRTLCVNPRFTDPDKEEHWTYSIREMTDLSQILRFTNM